MSDDHVVHCAYKIGPSIIHVSEHPIDKPYQRSAIQASCDGVKRTSAAESPFPSVALNGIYESGVFQNIMKPMLGKAKKVVRLLMEGPIHRAGHDQNASTPQQLRGYFPDERTVISHMFYHLGTKDCVDTRVVQGNTVAGQIMSARLSLDCTTSQPKYSVTRPSNIFSYGLFPHPISRSFLSRSQRLS